MLLADDLLDQPQTTGFTNASFLWWEGKRLLFNVIVGGYGAFCTIKYFREMVLIDFLAVIAFGILANVCFTFGWAVEHVVRYHTSGSLSFYKYRRIVFIAGIIFSLVTISLIDLQFRPAGM